MRLATTGFVGEGIAESLNRVEDKFIDVLRAQLADVDPTFGIDVLIVSPRILPSKIPSPPDAIRYKRNERSLLIAMTIPYGDWVRGSVTDRTLMYRDMLIRGLEAVPTKYLRPSERADLISIVNQHVTAGGDSGV
jgi:hypothetical protein